MSLPNRPTEAADRDAPTILFGLLADGSRESRFIGVDGPAFEAARASASRHSPSRDWYDRWAVRPLHGLLAGDVPRMDGGVCPDDIVILRRPVRGA